MQATNITPSHGNVYFLSIKNQYCDGNKELYVKTFSVGIIGLNCLFSLKFSFSGRSISGFFH